MRSYTLDSFAAFASASSPTITLTNGMTVGQDEIVPIEGGRFGLTADDGIIDVTDKLTSFQKKAMTTLFGYRNLQPLPTSTLGILANQLYNDPLSAPLDQLGKMLGGAGNTVGKQLTQNTGLQTLMLVTGLGIAAYLLWPAIKAKSGR